MELGYGLFIHFGSNTFAGTAWGDGRFPAAGFAPTNLDPAQWADMAAEAGMRYAVLTAKHHAGLTHGERWEWQALYDHIHRLQPDCLVIKNSSSDWPGDVRYGPVDGRTRLDPVFTGADGQLVYLPLEFCTTITPGWFWNAGQGYSHPSAAAISDWHETARAAQANFLLNIGPDDTGRLPEYHRPFLRQAAGLISRSSASSAAE